MKRRSFLGAVIGTVLGGPFIAEAAKLLPKKLTREDVFKLPIGDLKSFRVAMHPEGWDYPVWCPGIREIIKTDERIDFVAEDFEVFDKLKINTYALTDSSGNMITITTKTHPILIHAYPNDTIRVTYTLTKKDLE